MDFTFEDSIESIPFISEHTYLYLFEIEKWMGESSTSKMIMDYGIGCMVKSELTQMSMSVFCM